MSILFRRRMLCAGAAALLPLLPRVAPAQTTERVRWSDVQLIDGQVLPASQLNARTVVVYMYASWCPFCAKQSPLMQQLHLAQTRSPTGLLVLGFSIDRTEKAAHDYAARHGYTWAAAMATPQVEAWFGKRRSLPEVYVVDRGRVVHRESGEMFAEDVAALARFGER